MNAFDIALYGHLSFDNIYEGFNYKTSVGCIGNVWSQLKIINPDLRVKVEVTDIGESLIMADIKQCKRTSISRLSLKTNTPIVHDASVSHIMYLNELSDVSFIKDIKGFVTADTCNGKQLKLDRDTLGCIDLLLISEEDLVIEAASLASYVRNHVLVHTPAGSTLYSKNGCQQQFKAEFVPSINVLGAGDKFAAYILAGLLDYTQSTDKVIQKAHDSLTHYFKNEKI